MSWMQKLYRTYEAVSGQDFSGNDEPLTPVGHTLQNAHIAIVLNGQGEFQTARVMPPKTAIMLPATESSENRTSGEAPHPLADKIQYVAQDYAEYGGGKKAYFDGYRKQLQAWCDSEFSHPKVQAVLDYVNKGTVVADLVQTGIFQVDSDGKVLNKWEAESDVPPIFSVLPKTKGEIEFGSALVCWCVEIAGDVHGETWTDQSVQQSWIDYVGSSEAQKGFCLVQGMDAAISTMHPAKLRHTGDKAKLISSNDTAGYTFRGRFEAAEEAASVSTEVSAKAHSALRWLIARQGIRNGDQVTVAWAVSGKQVPSPLQDTFVEIDWDNLDTAAFESETETDRPSENQGGID
ncbi:type I-C CRISPR-associated protein Cas8c/Csd1, partial [Neisseria weixii]|uniref:type I-C CRISPR-associated protein Cas8c/Csd1 n=1 Tax=Neisseria weixii TaxID=1853276 RepID=UPI0035A18A5B